MIAMSYTDQKHQSRAVTARKEGPSGGQGGGPFSDTEISEKSKVLAVQVTFGEYVDSIRLEYQDENQTVQELEKHGGQGSTAKTFVLAKEDHLTGISGLYGQNIDCLSLHTQLGRTSELYGKYRTGLQPFEYKVAPGEEVIGFHGRSGALIDAIGIIIRKIP
jgi:hypothetical protein